MLAHSELDNNFLLENPIWKVELSNGDFYISDHKVVDDQSDWQRLKNFCEQNNLHIKNMWVSFRDNVKMIPNAKHYFFRRMSLGSFYDNGRVDKTYQYFVVGSTNDKNNIHLIKYLVPELTIGEEEDRVLEDSDPSLI